MNRDEYIRLATALGLNNSYMLSDLYGNDDMSDDALILFAAHAKAIAYCHGWTTHEGRSVGRYRYHYMRKVVGGSGETTECHEYEPSEAADEALAILRCAKDAFAI